MRLQMAEASVLRDACERAALELAPDLGAAALLRACALPPRELPRVSLLTCRALLPLADALLLPPLFTAHAENDATLWRQQRWLRSLPPARACRRDYRTCSR